VLSFLLPEQLTKTNQDEITANTFDDPYWVEKMTNKEAWSPLLTQQAQAAIDLVDDMLPRRRDLCVLGAGTGYDLQLLLRKRTFERVFASDISPGATSLIAHSLRDYPGKLGLFASEFGRCPYPKRDDCAGLVFQALHHANDAHAALAKILEQNFDDLVIVEPVTNRPLGFLAKFDLVQRVEYSGTRPDWLDLDKVDALATARGFKVASSRTWWEIPPFCARPWMDQRPYAWRTFGKLVDAFSAATNRIKFGSMAAIHLTRV
jgi:hypothetical protein